MPIETNNYHKMLTSCWVLTEGIAGTENQCLGVAQALCVQPEVKRVGLNQPWLSLSPYLGLEQHWSFNPHLAPPWPSLLIASGRKSIAASLYIKRQSKGCTFTVQIQDPRINVNQFDLVAVPAHDPTRGSNVIVTTAAPNKITPAGLEKARTAFPFLGELSGPRVAVLIGGTSKAYSMTRAVVERLISQLLPLDASLMITCSRRTGEENMNLLRESFSGSRHYFWDGRGENPYMALLGWADMILVTADSVSMLSESCTTGKPVYMIPLEGGNQRISILHQNLTDRGALRIFDGHFESWDYEPLNDALMVANEIKKRFSLF